MTSPSLKHAHPVAPTGATPTSPRARGGRSTAPMPATSTSPRLRGGGGVAYIAPPVTPRARHAHPPASIPLGRLWPVPPTWESPLIERLIWVTDVLTSHDQTEQRIGYRSRPKRFLEYGFLLEGFEVHQAEAVLYALQDEELEVPIWTDEVRVYSEISAGATAVPVTTLGLDYVDGGRAVLMAGDFGASLYGVEDTPWELLDVDEVQASQITLSAPVTRTWPAGTRVAPVRSGRLPASVSWSRPTAEGARGSVTLELTDAGHETLPSLVADEYRSVDVLPWRADRGVDIREDFARVVTRVESIGGTLEVIGRNDRPAISTGPRLVFDSRSDVLQLRAWLERCRGRRVSFWAGSGQVDLELAGPAVAADQWLNVKSVRGRRLYGQSHGPEAEEHPYRNPGRRDLEIRTAAYQDPIRRRIDSWHRTGDGTEQILLDSQLGVDLDADLAILSWLSLQRLQSDTVELRWTTDRIVEVDLDVRSCGQ